ncbi:MAG: GGDEF domain-containing protein [Proteobacteria bacterium]|nr:GGDEF domain-containing protein [Pseudomonadota bacterium]
MNNYKSIWQQYTKSKPELSLDEYESLQLEIAYLKKQLTTQSKLVKKLKNLTNQDSLTYAWNKKKFRQDLDKVIEYDTRYNRVSGVVFLDLNRFKNINERSGHLAGDLVLQHLTSLLKKSNRLNDEVYRLGGDQFAIILPNSDEDQLQSKASFLADLIQRSPCIYDKEKIYISASINIAVIDKTITEKTAIESTSDHMFKIKNIFDEQSITV